MTISDPLVVKEVKENVNNNSTENRRIPQNLMTKSKLPWIQNRVVHFTVSPKPKPHKGKTKAS